MAEANKDIKKKVAPKKSTRKTVTRDELEEMFSKQLELMKSHIDYTEYRLWKSLNKENTANTEILMERIADLEIKIDKLQK